MADNIRKENVQNMVKDLQKYLEELYNEDADLNEEENEFLQNALENLVTNTDQYLNNINREEDANSTEREEIMSESEYRCREMGGEWVPAHKRNSTYVKGFCRKKKR